MEEKQAIDAFSALAHEYRLKVFRTLIAEGPNGLAAGDIAKALAIPPSSLSFHLAQLERAGLLRSWRRQRNVFYAADIEGTRQLLAFLTQECCRGNPDICGSLGLDSFTCEKEDHS